MKKENIQDLLVVIVILLVGISIGYGIAVMDKRDTTPVIDLRKSDSLFTPTPSYYPYH